MSTPLQMATSSSAQPPLSAQEALRLLRLMQLIRSFEEHVRNLYSGGAIPGLVHLCAGQEAVAVGVCSLLGTEDIDRQQSSRPWPLPGQGRRRRSADGRGDGAPHRLRPRPRRHTAHLRCRQRQSRHHRNRRRRHSARRRRRAERQAARPRPGGRRLLRRRRAQPGPAVRGHEHGGDLAAAGAVRLRKQRLWRIHRHRGRHCRTRPDRARPRLRHSVGNRRRHGRARGPHSGATRARPRPRRRRTELSGLQYLPLRWPSRRRQAGLQGRRRRQSLAPKGPDRTARPMAAEFRHGERRNDCRAQPRRSTRKCAPPSILPRQPPSRTADDLGAHLHA